jgi:small subunit ribosomal protein S6
VRPYEVMIILDAELEEPAIGSVVDRGLEIIKTNGGTPGTVERWGKRSLAYEVNHKRDGYYVVAEFVAEPKASAELDRFLTLADEVVRHKIMRVPEHAAGRRRVKAPSGR